ncbi:hypothetical protein AB1Y20_012274 [Prymnesium parvum]|uniref:Plastid lipid-associated protein/fibrillin conserved domain-containing protein n=1 Tax=Prymnesium parvum TaxID=97485 RepID=A0AB34IN18_PRYPA
MQRLLLLLSFPAAAAALSLQPTRWPHRPSARPPRPPHPSNTVPFPPSPRPPPARHPFVSLAASADLRLSSSLPLATLDRLALRRVLRLADHIPTLATLGYFFLVATTQMAPPAAAGAFRKVITAAVGPTSNAAFSQMFATLVTPANFVFLIWPIIGALQLAAVLFSAARRGPPLKQSELSALSLANVCATTWLLISSNSSPGALPIWSCFVLPLVPIVSGYPLRVAEQPPTGLYALVFPIFSSFTTLASLVALTVELQYGGRIPFLVGKALPASPPPQAELCALIFASLVGVVVSLSGRTTARRCVNLLALVGIVSKRLAAGGALLLSPSFLALLGCLGVAAKQLVAPSADADGGAPS